MSASAKDPRPDSWFMMALRSHKSNHTDKSSTPSKRSRSRSPQPAHQSRSKSRSRSRSRSRSQSPQPPAQLPALQPPPATQPTASAPTQSVASQSEAHPTHICKDVWTATFASEKRHLEVTFANGTTGLVRMHNLRAVGDPALVRNHCLV